MIWHIVRLDMSAIDETTRASLESDLAGLTALEDVVWLRVARDVDDPATTGLMTAFVDYEALERYRVHPEHVPVLQRLRELEIPSVRLDIATDDDPATLP